MRKVILSVAVVFVVLVGAAGAYAAEPSTSIPESDLFAPDATPVACTSCLGNYTTSPGGGAASHWGMGTSCTNAQSDLTAQTRNAANNYCLGFIDDYPSCSLTVVVTGACWWNGSQYQVDGYANFKCRVWTGGPGCIIP